MKKLLALAALLWASTLVKAQTVLMLVMVIGASIFAAGTVIWLYAKNGVDVQVRWVVMEKGELGGPWTPVLTNKAIIGPKVFQDFPFAYVCIKETHQWYRARLADANEIPEKLVVAKLSPEAGVQPVVYSDAEIAIILERLNLEYHRDAPAPRHSQEEFDAIRNRVRYEIENREH